MRNNRDSTTRGMNAMLTLTVNGERHPLPEIDPSTPLLWVLRDELGLVGTKFV